MEPDLHWIGLSVPKRMMLWGAGLQVLTQMRPSVRSVERLVGKLGFAASVRPCLRSCFEEAYVELQRALEERLGTMFWTPAVHDEVMLALSLLPLATLDKREESSGRAVATDAPPGGHGYSYCRIAAADAHAWPRNAILKGEYTRLTAHSPPFVIEEETALKRVELPVYGRFWYHIGKPERALAHQPGGGASHEVGHGAPPQVLRGCGPPLCPPCGQCGSGLSTLR